ncbi:hypothetical protein [Staphylococcus felis]|uniref:hypothetical protein n=1 Tax=Staphylococcus felis TaxID=46127 RepID=UPI000CD07F60|nr:hypothetical protein [Staphylococcus felis]AVP37423.1 hypothetical protein C7J90_10820 [Staphylococcus felis]PNZ37101.1 hypothetical protein CD143_02555 [Staphylococcus felis]QQB02630.1 hypothetical protein I6H71_07690 [Staphylococcus felis]
MLTEEDLQYIKSNRAELIANRTQYVEITMTSHGVENPFTGELTLTQVTKEVSSVVTDRTSRVAAERRIYDGGEIIEGDVWFSIDVDEFEHDEDPRTITKLLHDDILYEVVSHDPKGIGEMTTRWEFVGKRVI